ncbi:SUN domain-containing protein 3-like isoform X1 [Girardinichthys multiradiatus]|uniref:SUN domain-containing protein 3-like isoform X1 n=1 Tax=Girardinichthys multiradiatus TaxID=208333 RepID=UPI001FAD2B55|nr:SUN domain-containing protein 3-like isoform X1 [Girardinichthys multiradiatus]XP_047215554.1 SUN domain-containing protein 3-like isoform X1 [Girardinichthys multiradiatus]XP_047215560.1 SUN domain-containing protein 3-like isoform X1 [Girardinichthys multiradiatus]XP_047215567.1 SUN domain-containing protein 3-like isoform X1 [Girardinichthys multiradiatus]XP_047215577.1 SUN domain-containing protein 3-like isoform X1 [Girardinichthys multiradiatus]XP_047215586.1 SUN domain-containing pro
MNIIQTKLRRSLRLLYNGYYNSDGLPTISYRETRVRRCRNRRPVKTDKTEVPVQDRFDSSIKANQKKYTLLQFWWIVIVLSLFYGNCSPFTNKQFGSVVENLSFKSHVTDCHFLLIPPHPSGSTCLFTALQSKPSESLITPATTDTVRFSVHNLNTGLNFLHCCSQVLTPGCKDQKKHSKELHEELLSLKKKLDYLLPSADLLPNFALESQGARILHQRTSDTYQRVEACRWFGLPIWQPAVGPKIVIQGKSHLLPGQCWAFAGSQGHLSIALSHRVSISHVSIGHIPKMVSPTGSISSAPREFSVYGNKDLEDEESLLGTFLYDEDGDHLQTFKLPDRKAGSFRFMRLQVNSNWGKPEYTCLYGFRVHGKLAQ